MHAKRERWSLRQLETGNLSSRRAVTSVVSGPLELQPRGDEPGRRLSCAAACAEGSLGAQQRAGFCKSTHRGFHRRVRVLQRRRDDLHAPRGSAPRTV